MKLTEDNLKLFAEVHEELMNKSEVIWRKFIELEPERHEWFSSIDNIDPDFDNELNQYFYVSGYDGSGACGVAIPIEYYIDENWIETYSKKVEERKEKERVEKELNIKALKNLKEKREREEYERLKKKYGV